MRIKFTIIVLLVVLVVRAQEPNERLVLPSIMIAPGEKAYKNIIDNKIPFNLKAGMATVNDAFKNFGFDTKDFEAAFNKLMRDGKLDECSQCSLTEMLFEDAVADVLVELEFEYVETAHGNKVTVIVEAIHFSSATSWASEVCESNYFNTTDITALTKSAINQMAYEDEEGNDVSYIEHFMQEIVDYLEKCSEYGAIADIRFTISGDSDCNMDCKLPQASNTRLKYVLEDWIEETSKDGYYKIKSQSENQLIVEEYRYECNSRTSKIERQLSRFLDELELDFKVKTSRATLYVELY
tara:strand:- start:12633 stop:13520 length:888 start_codon:yes stop_codon:yes gene_type:complete